jgi:hypothetical protein
MLSFVGKHDCRCEGKDVETTYNPRRQLVAVSGAEPVQKGRKPILAAYNPSRLLNYK